MSELPATWIETPATEIIAIHDARRVPLNASQRAEMKGNIPYYGANGLVDHVNDYLFDGEYVLLAEDGGYFNDPIRGVAYEASGKFWVNNHAHILEALGGISNRFLCYQLNAVNWMPFVGGSTRLKLTQGGLQQALVPVPPLLEQQRIVAKIDSLAGKSRRARDHLDHVPRLVEKYKQAVLAAAFRGDLTREWRASRKASDGWTLVSLDELVDEGPTNGWSPKSGPDATGALTLKLTATTSGIMRLDTNAVKRIYDTPPRKSNYWLRSGDLLVQRANSLEYVGASAIYEGPTETYIYPDLMMRLRIHDHDRRRYVWRFLNSPKAREYFQRQATGTAGNMPKISGGTLRALVVPVPTLDAEYAEVVQRIETAFVWIDRLAFEATSARKLIDHLDQSVLAKAFRGDLVPQDPADEPANVLLERIRVERSKIPKARRGRAKAVA